MRAFGVLLAVALLAGCMGGSSSSAPEPSTGSPEPTARLSKGGGSVDVQDALAPNETRVLHFWRNETYTAFVGNMMGVGFVSNLKIPNTPELSRINLTLTWTSPGNVQDLDAALSAPGMLRTNTGTEARFLRGQFMDVDGYHQRRAGMLGSPDVPSKVSVDETEIERWREEDCANTGWCDWTAMAIMRGGAVNVAYSLHAEATYVGREKVAAEEE